MMTSEYIEYCEDEVKMEIKSEVEDLELSQNRISAEFSEEDVKEEIVDEMNPHTNLVTYMCDICSKSCKSKTNLTQHIQSVHKGLKYLCNHCEYGATTQRSLKTHNESVHEKIKYPCNLCEYKATLKTHLKLHNRRKHFSLF